MEKEEDAPVYICRTEFSPRRLAAHAVSYLSASGIVLFASGIGD